MLRWKQCVTSAEFIVSMQKLRKVKLHVEIYYHTVEKLIWV